MMVVIAYASLMFVGLLDNLRGASYPLMLERFMLTKTTGSGFFWIASLSGIFMSYHFPQLRKRYSQRKLLQGFLLLLAVAGTGIAITSILGGSVWRLWPFIAILGLAMGGIGVSINVICSDFAPVNYRRQVLSGLHSMYGLSSMAAPLLLNGVLFLQLDWPIAFLVAATFPLITALGLAFKSSLKQQLKSLRDQEKIVEESHDFSLSPSFKKKLIFICLVFATNVCTEIYLSSRLVEILTGSFGFSHVHANEQLSYFFGLLLLGRMMFGIFKFPGHSVTWLILSLSLTLIVIIAGIYSSPRFFSFAGLTLSWFFPTAMEWVKEIFGQNFGLAAGKILATIGISLVLMHALVGFLTESLGQVVVLSLFPIVPLTSLFFLFLLKKQSQLSKV